MAFHIDYLCTCSDFFLERFLVDRSQNIFKKFKLNLKFAENGALNSGTSTQSFFKYG